MNNISGSHQSASAFKKMQGSALKFPEHIALLSKNVNGFKSLPASGYQGDADKNPPAAKQAICRSAR
jgi:hypothetical protein